jgi:hypothetical protein
MQLQRIANTACHDINCKHWLDAARIIAGLPNPSNPLSPEWTAQVDRIFTGQDHEFLYHPAQIQNQHQHEINSVA